MRWIIRNPDKFGGILLVLVLLLWALCGCVYVREVRVMDLGESRERIVPATQPAPQSGPGVTDYAREFLRAIGGSKR